MQPNLLLVLLSAEALLAISAALRAEWQSYKILHNKHYSSQLEDSKRFEIFRKNKLQIDRFNLVKSRSAGYKQSLNKYSDQSEDELLRGAHWRSLTGKECPRTSSVTSGSSGWQLPISVDWRREKRVTRVKDQTFCDAGFGFAAVGLLEGQQKPVMNRSEPIDLSVQQMIDCSGYLDCIGSELPAAMKFIVREEGGLMSEQDYPYVARDGKECHFDESKIVMSGPKNFTIVDRNDEEQMMEVVARYGPIAVSVNAIVPSFRHYKSGIYSDVKCSWDVTHSMLIVGYQREEVHEHGYWILKNSWGSDWGEDGYMRMELGANMCCIAYEPITETF